jgi:hypothetical protein
MCGACSRWACWRRTSRGGSFFRARLTDRLSACACSRAGHDAGGPPLVARPERNQTGNQTHEKYETTWVYGMMLLAGLMDATTGALLLAAPLWTLDLMGITSCRWSRCIQRWIGAFVCSVGCSYLFPFLLPAGPARDQRSRGHPDHGHHRAHLHRRLLRGGHRHRRARTGLAFGDVHRRDAGCSANFVLRKKFLDPSDA